MHDANPLLQPLGPFPSSINMKSFRCRSPLSRTSSPPPLRPDLHRTSKPSSLASVRALRSRYSVARFPPSSCRFVYPESTRHILSTLLPSSSPPSQGTDVHFGLGRTSSHSPSKSNRYRCLPPLLPLKEPMSRPPTFPSGKRCSARTPSHRHPPSMPPWLSRRQYRQSL